MAKRESMLTRQRRLLKEQKARKAAREAAKTKASKTLPSRGNTGGNSLKSRGDRKATAKRVAGQQQRVISEAMRKTLKQRSAMDRQESAAKGTKGKKVQTGTRTKGGPLTRQGPSTPTKTKGGSPASQRVSKVRVKVQPQKALPPSSQKALPAGQKALPPGKKGGPVSTNNRPRRRNVNTNPPSNTTRTGRQAPGAANREVQATRRAGVQSRKPNLRQGLLAPLMVGGAIGHWMTNNLSRRPTPNGRGSGRATDNVRPGPPKKEEREFKGPGGNPNGTGQNQARQRPLTENQRLARSDRKMDRTPKAETPTKPPSRTAPTRTAPTRTTPTKTTPTKPARKPQSKDMDANYKAWAKANPKLAKKVKKGQAGYKAINGTPNKDSIKPKRRTWLADNYKPNKKKK